MNRLNMRWDVLNHLARYIGAQRYLEIGVSQGDSMRRVEVKEKWGVDPAPTLAGVAACDVFLRMTSVDLLTLHRELLEKRPPDLVFIDGYHSAEMVTTEVGLLSSLPRLRGLRGQPELIALHDVGPTTELMQSREPVPGDWTGDVWKAVVQLRRDGVHDVRVIDVDYGVAIVKPWAGKVAMPELPRYDELTWEILTKNRRELLGIIDEGALDGWLVS